MRRLYFTILNILLIIPQLVNSQPSGATPNYYYNHETAFLINYAIDHEYGGLYMATNGNGNIVDLSNLFLWNGYAPEGTSSSQKTPSAQAIAILYFIREYHRLKINGVEGLNNNINNTNYHFTNEVDALTIWAKSIADFVVTDNPFKISSTAQTALGGNANKMYYYGTVDRKGENGIIDGTSGSSSPESMLPWALTELALIMKEAGLSSTLYQPYIDHALGWWNWRKTTAVYTGYGWGQFNQYGAGRDTYYGPLGLTLYELTGTQEYKDGSTNMNDGKPLGGAAYMYAALGSVGNNPDLGNPPSYSVQDGAYVAGYARGVCYAKAKQRSNIGLSNYNQHQPWQEFGFSPLYERGGSWPSYTMNSPSTLETTYGMSTATPFEHFKGRELYSSVNRTLWFNYSFGVNQGLFYANNGSNPNYPSDFTPDASINMAKEYWDFCLDKFWDNTNGVAAWTENTGTPVYKPCFSGGVDVPIGDWKAPSIGSSCAASWTSGTDATISVNNVLDESFDFLSFKFDGSGIQTVEIVYSLDDGVTWQSQSATSIGGNNYTATINAATINTAHTNGYDFFYFTRAVDKFGNYATFPTDIQDISSITGILDAEGNSTSIRFSKACTIERPYVPARLGDYVWLDENANGIQDDSESGVENVIVKLYDRFGNEHSTKQTNALGFYEFDNLKPNNYTLEFLPPTNYVITHKEAGTDTSKDSDIDRYTKRSASIKLLDNDDIPIIDAGITLLNLKGTVWFDNNLNGLRDVEETLLENVTVKLYNSDGNEVQSIKTSPSGCYEFIGVSPGNYKIGFDTNTHTNTTNIFGKATVPGAIGNSNINDSGDSDIGEYTLITEQFSYGLGNTMTNIDAGFTTIPLPVELTYFKGQIDDCITSLEWETSSEIDNSHFMIEYSTDGITFNTCGIIKGMGNSSAIHTYNYTHDIGCNYRVLYYRLKQVDFSGSYEYSNTIVLSSEIEYDNTPRIDLFPNPSNGKFTVRIKGLYNENLDLSIINLNGNIVYHQLYNLNELNGNLSLNMSSYLETGLYILTLKHKDLNRRFKIYIE